MRTVVHQSFFSRVIFIFLIINAQFSYASSHDENLIDEMFATYGKTNVVNFILQNRNGKITIQKNKSFLNVRGRPDMTLVTAKSINYDLKLLKMNVNNLSPKLDKYTQEETEKKQKKESKLKEMGSRSSGSGILLSEKLRYKIVRMQLKQKEADSDYERRRLKRELRRLERKYNDAKYNEKHGVSNGLSGKSQQGSRYKKNTRYCDRYKSQLKELTSPSYRYQVFYCNDRSARSKNPKSCSEYRYSRRYSRQEYKDKINKIRQSVSESCSS